MNDWMNDCWSFDWGRGTNSDWGDGFRWVQVTSPANSDFLSDFDYLILKLLETMINLVIIPKKYKSRFQGWRRPKITPVATPMVGSVSVLEFLRLPLVFLNRNYGCISLMHPGCWFCVLLSQWKKSCLWVVRLVFSVSHPRSCWSFSVNVLNGVPATSFSARLPFGVALYLVK